MEPRAIHPHARGRRRIANNRSKSAAFATHKAQLMKFMVAFGRPIALLKAKLGRAYSYTPKPAQATEARFALS